MEMNVQALYASGLSKNLTSRPIAASSVNASGKAFGNILAEKENEARQVKFSKHASLRMSDRGLEMSDEQLGRLSNGNDTNVFTNINGAVIA